MKRRTKLNVKHGHLVGQESSSEDSEHSDVDADRMGVDQDEADVTDSEEAMGTYKFLPCR